MGEADGGYPATEQAAAHPGSSPRILARYRARGGGPPCVSCCGRVQDLRSGLDERIGGDGCPVAVEAEDDCGRDGHGMDAGGKKVPQQISGAGGLGRSGAVRSGLEAS